MKLEIEIDEGELYEGIKGCFPATVDGMFRPNAAENVLRLLKGLAGVDVAEVATPDDCCGGDGACDCPEATS